MQGSEIGIPVAMIEAVREGRYATSVNGQALTFTRIQVVKERKGMSFSTRRYLGWMKVQTWHGDGLIDRFMLDLKTGHLVPLHNRVDKTYARDLLLSIIVNQRSAAIRFGQELGQCCRCGKTLTNERSRYYSIGPDCEQDWPDILDEVDDQQGVYVEGVMSR